MARSPIDDFEGIRKGSGWNAWRKEAQSHLSDEAEAMNAAANWLKEGILKKSKWPWALDKRMTARRITRPLYKAAELLNDASSCTVIAGREYNAAFTRDQTKPGQDDLDPAA